MAKRDEVEPENREKIQITGSSFVGGIGGGGPGEGGFLDEVDSKSSFLDLLRCGGSEAQVQQPLVSSHTPPARPVVASPPPDSTSVSSSSVEASGSTTCADQAKSAVTDEDEEEEDEDGGGKNNTYVVKLDIDQRIDDADYSITIGFNSARVCYLFRF